MYDDPEIQCQVQARSGCQVSQNTSCTKLVRNRIWQQLPVRCIDSQVWSASCQSVRPVYAAVHASGGCRRRRRASLVFPRQNSFLVCFRCGSPIWPKKQFNVAWTIRRDNGQPFELACWYVRFLHEAQGIRMELEGFVLIVHKHARQFDGGTREEFNAIMNEPLM
jgi:hypothetical protein